MGQEQRVAIARAIVTDPRIIVADEPTGDLDRTSASEILSLLRQINQELGRTLIMVTHDPKTTEYTQETLHLEKGRLLESECKDSRTQAGTSLKGRFERDSDAWNRFLATGNQVHYRRRVRSALTITGVATAMFLFYSVDAMHRASRKLRSKQQRTRNWSFTGRIVTARFPACCPRTMVKGLRPSPV